MEQHGEFISFDYKDDHWDFYQDAKHKWRWKRTAPNQEIVGASTQGYAHFDDCLANARRHGYLMKFVPLVQGD